MGSISGYFFFGAALRREVAAFAGLRLGPATRTPAKFRNASFCASVGAALAAFLIGAVGIAPAISSSMVRAGGSSSRASSLGAALFALVARPFIGSIGFLGAGAIDRAAFAAFNFLFFACAAALLVIVRGFFGFSVGIFLPSLLTDGYFFFRWPAAALFIASLILSSGLRLALAAFLGAAAFLGVGGDVRATRTSSAFRNASFCAAVGPVGRFTTLRAAGFLRTVFRIGAGIFLSSLLLRLLLRLRMSWCGLVSASSGRVWHDASSMPPAYEASRCWHASLRWDPIGSR